jgi:uncharacterized protein (DUF433 family)
MLARVHTPMVLGPLLHCIVVPLTISLIELGVVVAGGYYVFVGKRIRIPGVIQSLGAGAAGAYLYHAYMPEEIF